MLTDTEELVSIEDLVGENDTICETDDCDNVAEWFARTLCCNDRMLSCQKHYSEWMGEYFRTQAGSANPRVQCLECGSTMSLYEFAVWTRI